jgi:hypothetical protein
MSTEEWKETAIRVADRPVKGKYCVFDGQVTAAAWNGTKTAQLGIPPAERLAKMLLRELASEEDKKSWTGYRQGPLNGAQRTS